MVRRGEEEGGRDREGEDEAASNIIDREEQGRDDIAPARERPARREKDEGHTEDGNSRRRKRQSNYADGSSSDDSSHRPSTHSHPQHVFSFVKAARGVEHPLPPEAVEVLKQVLEYRANDLNAAVLAFCWKSGKHHDFPDALVRDLLQYKFINLEKINAGLGACKFDIFARSKDSDPAAKIKPKPFKEATEWRDAVTLLVETLCIGFVGFLFFEFFFPFSFVFIYMNFHPLLYISFFCSFLLLFFLSL